MTLLTVFTAPKPFTDPHIATIQRNALRSWQQLPDTRLLMIGDETGMADVAADLGIKHLPEVARNQWGTPLVSSIFKLGRANGDSPLLGYVNADILLFPDFVASCRAVLSQAATFLLIGKRWDLDITEPLAFSGDWAGELVRHTRSAGRLHPPAGSDYFVFPRHVFEGIPPFAIGRAGWDNWMIYHARRQGWPVIDGTPDIMIVHQNHDYAHLGGRPHYDHIESKVNIELAGGPDGRYTGYMVLDTTRELRAGRVVPARLSIARLIRQVELVVMPREKKGPRWSLTRRLRRLRRKLSI